MKFYSLFFGLLLVSFSSAFPKDNPDNELLGMVQGMLGKAVKRNIDKMCLGTGLMNTCPKPLQYCDMRIPLMICCRYNGGAWFLFIGVPLIVIGIIIGVVFYVQKR